MQSQKGTGRTTSTEGVHMSSAASVIGVFVLLWHGRRIGSLLPGWEHMRIIWWAFWHLGWPPYALLATWARTSQILASLDCAWEEHELLSSPHVCPHMAKRLLCSMETSALPLEGVRIAVHPRQSLLSRDSNASCLLGNGHKRSYHVPPTVLA